MTDDVADKIDDLTRWVERLEREVADGAMADLTGLDERVKQACNTVVAASPESREALQPRLVTLLEGIDRLQALMHDQFAGIQAELQAHGRRSQAARAYSQWSPSTPSKDD